MRRSGPRHSPRAGQRREPAGGLRRDSASQSGRIPAGSGRPRSESRVRPGEGRCCSACSRTRSRPRPPPRRTGVTTTRPSRLPRSITASAVVTFVNEAIGRRIAAIRPNDNARGSPASMASSVSMVPAAIRGGCNVGGTTWTNWVGNQSFAPAAIVRHGRGGGRRRRSRGGRRRPRRPRRRRRALVHAGLPPTASLLDLPALTGVVAVDRPRCRATALRGDHGPRVRRPAVGRRARAARTRATSTPSRSPAPSATATHGSGIRSTLLSGVVRGVRLVTATGDVRRDRRGEPELLRAAQVSIGMLGVMTQVELEVTAAYRLTRADRALCRGRGDRRAGTSWSPTTATSGSSGCPPRSRRPCTA